jgi:hypothetical protein
MDPEVIKIDIENYITVVEACSLMEKAASMVARLCQTGKLPGAKKISNTWLIPRESVLNYKPMKRGVKPGTRSKKAQLAAERAAILEQAKGPELRKAKRAKGTKEGPK